MDKFIKWKVSYAEGFELNEDQLIFPEGGVETLTEELLKLKVWKLVWNPLLNQKAIEGWNLSSPKYYIQQSDYICIHDDYNAPCDFKNMPISDQAKEAALKYIYEQEKKA